MAINNVKPMRRVGVGAQYLCFHAEPGEGGVLNFETDVSKMKTVASIETSEESSTEPVYGSNEVYETDVSNEPPTLAVESLAFPPLPLARMRGSKVKDGFVTRNTYDEGEYFAYGVTYPKKSGKTKYVWYPKCKLVSMTDAAKTKDKSGLNTQNPKATIQVETFNDAGDFQIEYDTELLDEGTTAITEDKFYEKPLLAPLTNA